MARRRRVEEHENHERWLVSYADFITLLFAFFVVMYSISSLNVGKYKVLSQTLVAAFTGTPMRQQVIQTGQPYSSARQLVNLPPLPRPTSLVPRRQSLRDAQQVDRIARAVQRSLAPQIARGQVDVRLTPTGVAIDIHDSLLFASGQAGLAPSAQPVLARISELIAPLPYEFQVNGYTDDQPIRTAQFQSNWDLSSARAVSVVDMLIAQGVPPQQLVAAGYGQYHPIASNATEAGRAANRRVSIVVVTPDASASSPGISQ